MNSIVGQSVYLDWDQCDSFKTRDQPPDHRYYDDGARLIIAANQLLESKGGNGYDDAHKQLLEPLGSVVLDMVRMPHNGPGWFTVTAILS